MTREKVVLKDGTIILIKGEKLKSMIEGEYYLLYVERENKVKGWFLFGVSFRRHVLFKCPVSELKYSQELSNSEGDN